MKHFLNSNDLVLVRRAIKLSNDSWSNDVMTVSEALKLNQWDTTRGTMAVFITIVENEFNNRLAVYGRIGDDTVYKSKNSAYIYLLEPYEIEDYDIHLVKMKKHMLEMEQFDATRND